MAPKGRTLPAGASVSELRADQAPAGHKRTLATGLDLPVCFPPRCGRALAGLKNSRYVVRKQQRPKAETKGRKGGRSQQ